MLISYFSASKIVSIPKILRGFHRNLEFHLYTIFVVDKIFVVFEKIKEMRDVKYVENSNVVIIENH